MVVNLCFTRKAQNMKKNKCKEVLILGDKKRVIKRLERRAKEAIDLLERFENGAFF